MKSKVKINTFCVIVLALYLQYTNAQTVEPKVGNKLENTIDGGRDSQWFLGPVSGFKAIKNLVVYDLGLQLSRSLSEGQRVRFEVSYRFAGSNLEQNWGKIPMNMKSDISSLMIGGGYEWFPYVGNGTHSNFIKSLKVIGGAWYLNRPEYKFDASLQEALVWGDLTFSVEEIGAVATTIKTNRLQPYLGLGYDSFYVSKKINFSINGGVLYQGQPKVSMVATNMLKPTEESAARLEDNLKSYQFSPFVQLLVQFSL